MEYEKVFAHFLRKKVDNSLIEEELWYIYDFQIIEISNLFF